MTGSEHWFVYLVRCNDGSLYCGITNDLQHRINAHNSGKGAKYTRGRGPVELVYVKHMGSKSDALKFEHKVKQLSRLAKEVLIESHNLDPKNLVDIIARSAHVT